VTNLASSLTCTLTSATRVVDITVATSDGSSTIAASTLIEFIIQDVLNPPTLSESTSFTVQTLTSTTAPIYLINSRTTGVTITNTLRGEITDATAVPTSESLNAITNYTITFTPTNSLPQSSSVLVGIPEEITVTTGPTMLCTSITYIEATLSCTYESANRVVTVSNGFIINSDYAASEISFKLEGLTNPSTALTTESFTIETKDNSGFSIDFIDTGVSYTKACDSPCSTCSGNLSNCTSCASSSNFPFLQLST
jgi:hypothetical protein